jgi:hypothetical protein
MRTIEISEETYERIKDQIGEDSFKEISAIDDLIGEKWFVRTITYHLVGKITKRIGHFIEMKDASWVADSGRFMNAIKEGTLSEVEPVGRAFVNMDSITDMFPWKHDLPKEQK